MKRKLERAGVKATMGTPDQMEGMQAFLEKESLFSTYLNKEKRRTIKNEKRTYTIFY